MLPLGCKGFLKDPLTSYHSGCISLVTWETNAGEDNIKTDLKSVDSSDSGGMLSQSL
jgi:hypothetical protein